jgi:hypothetical protein
VSDGAAATFTVAFGRSGHLPSSTTTIAFRSARVTRHLALAHAARVFSLTRARVTQIVNLTLLAPAIQEKFLAMPSVERGRDLINERVLRPIVAEPVWERQMVIRRRLRSRDAA